jgi:hypothetical protein
MSTTSTTDYSAVPERFAAAKRAVLEAYGPRVVERVRARWPVVTGTSSAAFAFSVEQVGSVASLRLTNDAEYTPYVHRAGSKVPLLDALTDEVVAELGPQIANDLAAAMVEILNTPTTPRRL